MLVEPRALIKYGQSSAVHLELNAALRPHTPGDIAGFAEQSADGRIGSLLGTLLELQHHLARRIPGRRRDSEVSDTVTSRAGHLPGEPNPVADKLRRLGHRSAAHMDHLQNAVSRQSGHHT